MFVWPCDQNVPRKIGKASPAGYTHIKITQRLTKDQVVVWLYNLAWFHLVVEPAKLSEVAEICKYSKA